MALPNLPTEILIKISCHLCNHCFPHDPLTQTELLIDLDNYGIPDIEKIPDLDSLRSLSQTCSLLRAPAQQVLHHALVLTGANCISLVRTLAQRPDLADSVTSMHITQFGWAMEDDGDSAVAPVGADDVILFNSTMAKFIGDINGRPLRLWDPGLLQSPHPPGEVRTRHESVLSLLALALIRNVKRLEIDDLVSLRLIFSRPGSLPLLTHLRWVNTGFGRFPHPVGLRDLVGAAPKLENFEGVRVFAALKNLSCPSLRRLELEERYLDAKAIKTFLHETNKLEYFSFKLLVPYDLHAQTATPREISEALQLTKETLKHLYLEFTEWHTSDNVSAANALVSLKDMHALETVDISAGAIFWGLADDIEAKSLPHRLTNLLPRSIRDLTLYLPRKWGDYDPDINQREGAPYPHIIHLAKVSVDEFPNLKKVTFVNFLRPMQTLVELEFNMRGIETSLHNLWPRTLPDIR